MNSRKLTVAESTKAARKILSRSTCPVDVNGWIVEMTLRDIGTGFHVPSNVFADETDVLTQKDLAAWLRRFAVDTAAETIASRQV